MKESPVRRRDNLESIPRTKRRYRFFFSFFVSASNFSENCVETLVDLWFSLVKFSPEISLVLRHATSSFRSWKKSIYSPPPLCSCSLFRFAHAKPRNDFNHVNEIAWNFFRGNGSIIRGRPRVSLKSISPGSRGRPEYPSTAASGLFFFLHDKLRDCRVGDNTEIFFPTILIYPFTLIKSLRFFFSFLFFFKFATFHEETKTMFAFC